ncbi:MAG: hypothetical protein A2Y17_07950 [Clostridiales bacterium GWF2_38_85]|nr:MAG: hypothetical protein A2Y17_07950 [Clostridiales bacterium GWF2_38_85]HBL84191.1 peptidoglycan editing factor PgeF [Clostridiales bacterium]
MVEAYTVKQGLIKYLVSPLFEKYHIPHLFSTRAGGVSKGVFESLNFSVGQGNVKDSRENVEHNHMLAAKQLGSEAGDICRTYQTHSTNVEFAQHKNCGIGFEYGVDGLITNEEHILLSIRTADCTPILIFDTENNACAAVHSGWRGALNGIIIEAVQKMQKQYGSDPRRMIAAIGPAAQVCCYEVGKELYESFHAVSSEYDQAFILKQDKLYLSVPEINVIQLIKLGVPEQNISQCSLCTICNPDLFFSHRRMGTVRGTMAAFIKIREKIRERKV